MSPELAALTFALGIYTAAFIAEIVRAGILAMIRAKGSCRVNWVKTLKSNEFSYTSSSEESNYSLLLVNI